MPGKPPAFLARDLEIRASTSGPQGRTVNILTHRGDTDPHPAWDAVMDAECQELAILDDNNIQQVVLVAASEAGTVGLLVPMSTVVGRLASGNVVALTAADIISILSSYGSLLPSADPHVVGQWWSNSGVVTISAG